MSDGDIEISVFNKEELFTDCTVQVLVNTFTGQQSVGWWENEKPMFGRWHSVLEDGLPRKRGVYIVLWCGVCDYAITDKPDLYYEMVDFNGKVWDIKTDIPQAEEYGGADILWWMSLPEKPNV